MLGFVLKECSLRKRGPSIAAAPLLASPAASAAPVGGGLEEEEREETRGGNESEGAIADAPRSGWLGVEDGDDDDDEEELAMAT